MAEEIERRLSISRADKRTITEILQTDGDSIKEITIKFVSGNVMVIR